MKQPSGITTVESKISVPVALLEDHVNNKHHAHEEEENAGYPKKGFSLDYENILWCTEELELDGAVEIHLSDQGCWRRRISIPVTTAMLVICTKGRDDFYKLTWSSSLS